MCSSEVASPEYADAMKAQIDIAQTKGRGKLADLLMSGANWTVCTAPAPWGCAGTEQHARSRQPRQDRFQPIVRLRRGPKQPKNPSAIVRALASRSETACQSSSVSESVGDRMSELER